MRIDAYATVRGDATQVLPEEQLGSHGLVTSGGIVFHLWRNSPRTGNAQAQVATQRHGEVEVRAVPTARNYSSL